MSVIAKLIVRQVHNFGTGKLTELSCVAPNDMMAAYAETEENRLFTKYSPSGEMKLHHPAGLEVAAKDAAVYVMMLRPDEVEGVEDAVLAGERVFPGAVAVCKARVVSLTDFGDNSAKVVEICNSYDSKKTSSALGVDNFNWKMAVDNPPATAQFKPGQDGYWVAFYPEARFDRDAAIRAAHGHPEPEAA